MSQSDYLKYKKIATQIKLDMSNNMPPVFECQNYLNFKQYSLENTVKNTKTIYNKITPSGETIIFDMEINNNECPTVVKFPICTNTNKRANRRVMSGVYFDPTPQPITIKELKNAKNQKKACSCGLNSKYTNPNLCKCKLGAFGPHR